MVKIVEVIESYEELEGYEKVATLDMGGTLVSDPDNTSTQARINMAFGLAEEEEKQLYEEYAGDNGDLVDHADHARAQTEALRGRPSANIEVYADTVQDIIEDREIVPGAHDFVQKLQDQNYETMIVSSAPTAVTLPFAEELEADKLYRWKDFEFTDEGYFDHANVKEEARKGKQGVVKGLQELGVETAHFGNGKNDKTAVEVADGGLKQCWLANPEKAFEYAFQEARNL